ncbi:MAG: twin-arginine translocation signal domain-containing protein [Candidatus Nanohaloarchaea archaeon]
MGGQSNRRDFLKAVGTVGLAGVAGCAGDGDYSPPSTTGTPSGTSTTSAGTTTRKDAAPQILSYEAAPQQYGTVLAVSMQGEDDTELEEAAILYGDQQLQETPDGKTVTLEGEFEPDSDLESPDQVAYLLRDAAGNKTRKKAYPDQDAPELALKATATDNAGEIELMLEGKDNVGLQELAAALNGETARQKDVSEAKKASIDTTVTGDEVAAIQPGKMNTVNGTIRDQYDNATEKELEQYVRKYDVLEDTKLDIGVDYIPWIGSKFGDPLSHSEVKPAIGYYEDFANGSQNEVANRHIDQMQGHGITKLMFGFGENNKDYERFRNFDRAGLSDEIEIELFYALPQVFRRNRNLNQDITFMRKEILSKDNYSTINGRPVVNFWKPSALIYNKNLRNRVEDKYGGLIPLFEYVQTNIAPDGEKKAFMVGDANQRGYWDGKSGFGAAEDFWSKWDGLTSFAGRPVPDEKKSHEESLEFHRKDYKGIQKFADKHNQDFYPMVIPGFNDTHNEDWGQNRVIPRSISFFYDLLTMAEKFADGRINIYSFNEWTEGTQIESGKFKENSYGNSYLKTVKKFQRES